MTWSRTPRTWAVRDTIVDSPVESRRLLAIVVQLPIEESERRGRTELHNHFIDWFILLKILLQRKQVD